MGGRRMAGLLGYIAPLRLTTSWIPKSVLLGAIGVFNAHKDSLLMIGIGSLCFGYGH